MVFIIIALYNSVVEKKKDKKRNNNIVDFDVYRTGNDDHIQKVVRYCPYCNNNTFSSAHPSWVRSRCTRSLEAIRRNKITVAGPRIVLDAKLVGIQIYFVENYTILTSSFPF